MIAMRLITMSVVVCVFTSAAGAWQDGSSSDQTSPPAKESVSKDKTDASPPDDLLGGPKVTESADSQTGPGFGVQDARRVDRRQALPFNQWVRVILAQELMRDQRRQVAQIVTDHRQKTQQYQQEHGRELRELRQQIQQMRRTDAAPPPELVQRARRLQSAAPSPQEAQEKIWALLDESQQETARQALDAAREEMLDRQRTRRGDPMRDGVPMTGDSMMSEMFSDESSDEIDDDLDAMARRRVEFLRARQKPSPARDRRRLR